MVARAMLRNRKNIAFLILSVVALYTYFYYFPFGETGFEESFPRAYLKRLPPYQRNATFVKMKLNSLFFFSAYADWRLGHVVRLIGMAKHDKLQRKYEGLTCVISRPDDAEMVLAKVQHLREGHKMQYDAIFVLCKSNRPLTNGTKVGLSYHDKELDFLLPVQGIPRRPSNSGMTVCYPPLHGNYDDVEKFVENIEMNLILGFRQFFVYVYEVGPRVRKAIASYAEEGIVHVVSWKSFPLASGNMIHYMGQMVAINDCLYRAMNNPFRVVAFHDFDELIIPHGPRSLPEIVEQVMRGSVSGLSVRCAMFSTQYVEKSIDMVEQVLKNGPRLQTQTKTLRVEYLFPHRHRSKMLVAADKVDTMGIHFVWEFLEGHEIHLNAEMALLHHYRYWEDPFRIVDRAAWRYGTILVEKVMHRLKRIGQIVENTSRPENDEMKKLHSFAKN